MNYDDLKFLEKKLAKAKEILKSMVLKDVEIKDSELVKFNSHGQWSVNTAIAPGNVNDEDRQAN